ncbi:ANTAR domain-containing protein [Streptomyces monomycini]|uniref:ANTAR domain-containing protein n=1 Tax=Streptomyces monomycini TaxID=371720 RepID=UPI0007C5AAC8|nr:ANTAR domain-containing protein [Streptomyces monomycini]
MPDDAFRDVRKQLQTGGPGPSARWCARCAALLGLDGAAISLCASLAELMWFSDEVSARLEDLQFTLGQGPTVEAAECGALCLVADVAGEYGGRWPQFAAGAEALGVRAVFAFPLSLGPLTVGALTFYRRSAHAMGRHVVDDALVLCDALTVFLLSRSDGHKPPALRLARSVELHRAEVHQATGMLSVQLQVSASEALLRLRAHAYSAGRPITEVAHDILARRLTLAEHPHSP